MTIPPIGMPNDAEHISLNAFTYDTHQKIAIRFWDEFTEVNLDSISLQIEEEDIPFHQST